MKCENLKCKNDLSPLQEKGGQRFCCISCSNSGVPRISRPESRAKVAKSISNLAKVKHCKCKICKVDFTVFRKRRSSICTPECLYISKILNAQKAAATMKANGNFSGWHNRKGERSYPEKYFESIFENENIIGWSPDLKVGRWFIDFAFEDKMIAVEIDGRQHEDSDRKKSDEEKDKFLKQLGWKVIRIPWSNPKDQLGKNKLYPHIKNLLNVLNDQLFC